jgi:hypothetical protein
MPFPDDELALFRHSSGSNLAQAAGHLAHCLHLSRRGLPTNLESRPAREGPGVLMIGEHPDGHGLGGR